MQNQPPAKVARLAAKQALAQDGVKRLRFRPTHWLLLNTRPAISVTIDDYGRVHADVAVIAKLGWDLPDLGRRVQHAVYDVIRQHMKLPIGEINVTIAGVKEDARYAPTEEDFNP